MMTGESRKDSKIQLAFAIAKGTSMATWASNNEVPERTAFRWARDPWVRRMVESCRRRMLDEAIGRMTARSAWAADAIVRVAEESVSDSLRFRACRAIFSEVITVSKFSGLESRMTEIEVELEKRAGKGGHKLANWKPTDYARRPTPAAEPPVASSGPG
jgi:hypothetical protein